jgi:hypothetical protein
MSEEPLSDSSDQFPEANTPEEYPASEVHGLTRAERRARRRAERRSRRGSGGPWILGAILIVMGVGFLAATFGLIDFTNWWALFIFIPAVASFVAAGRRYQAAGRLTSGVLGSVLGGVVLSAVALGFLLGANLGWNWGLFWPVLLILGGVAVLLQYAIR